MAVEVAEIEYLDHEGLLALVFGPSSPEGIIPVDLQDPRGRLPHGDIFFAPDDVAEGDAEAVREGAIPVLIEVDVTDLPAGIEVWDGLPLPRVSYRPARLRDVSVGDLLRWAYAHVVRGQAPVPAEA